MRPSLVKSPSADASAAQRLAVVRETNKRRQDKRELTPKPAVVTDTAAKELTKPEPRRKRKPKRKPRPLVTPAQRKHLHLLNRTTFGLTPAAAAGIAKVGTSAWLEAQLNPTRIPDPLGDRIRSLFPEMGRNVTATRNSQPEFHWDSMFALGQGSLALSIWSSRQLYEVMVDFWSNHLNVTSPSDGVWDNRADYDARVIRANALGKYSQMLVASATHPAMLRYLNNASSTKYHPNENYGRELLELHTVGVDAKYGENGVIVSSRIMTGWTVDWRTGLAKYDPDIHWTGPVSVFGFNHANASRDGQAIATSYINYLARRPETAKRIAYKLGQRFVSDTPPSSLVNRLASVYLSNDTEIKPVLRALFRSTEFWAARGRKVKRPMEDLAATVRAVGHQLLPTSASTSAVRAGVEALYWMSWDLQNAPHNWSLPTGYPDVASEWASAELALGKINTHRMVAEGWWPSNSRLNIVKPQRVLPKPIPATYGALIDRTAVRLIGTPLNAVSKNAILRFFGKSASSRVGPTDEVLRWRAGALVTLILDSPTAAVK